jgi:hypothetical protein
MNKQFRRIKLVILCLNLVALVFPTELTATTTSPNYSLEGESFNAGIETEAESSNYSTHGEISQPGGHSQSGNYNLNQGLLFVAVHATSPTPIPGVSSSPGTSAGSSSTTNSSSGGGSSSIPVSDSSLLQKAVTNLNMAVEPIIQKYDLEKPLRNLLPKDENDLVSLVILSLLILLLVWFLLLQKKKKKKYLINPTSVDVTRSFA